MEIFPEETYLDPFYASTAPLHKYKGTWLPGPLYPDKTKLDNVLNMNIRPSDIIVTSYPKSGTTWLQQIIWKVCCVKHPELKQEEIDSLNLDKRFPMLDDMNVDFKEIENRPSPRFLKYHMPYHLLPYAVVKSSPKILHIARDVRDVAVSYYHFMKLLAFITYTGTPEDMCRAIIDEKDAFGPWAEHVKSFWTRRNDDNVLFLIYEELQLNPAHEINRVAEFLEVKLSKDQLNEIVRETSFSSMKKDDSTNYSWLKEEGKARPEGSFMRKGITGDYKNHISENLAEDMYKKLLQPLREIGLVFGD